MKWYKHLSGSLNNSFIFELIEKFGGDGYLVFFGTLELMSDEFDIYNPGVVKLRIKKLTQNLQLSRQKTLKVLRFCDQKANENSKKEVSFFVDIQKNDVIINCKKLARLCDNHTKKLMGDTLKLLPSEKEVTSAQRSKKKEVRSKSIKDIVQKDKFYLTKKGRKLNGKRLETFDLFWDAFNYKKSRSEASDAWFDIPELTENLVDDIIKAAKTEALNRSELIKNGRIPKMAQGWLSGRRWEDEPDPEPKKIYVDIKPQTYAQAQDLERRGRAAWLKKEMENDKQERSGEGTVKAISLLPGDPV